MVKSPVILATAAAATFLCVAYGEGITNIIQCINASLTSDVLGQFPTNATASVQNCVLTFVKGSVSGDLKTFASPFSDQIRSSEFGISDLDNVPISVSNEFSVLMSSISNCTNKVIAYDETTSNGLIRSNITIHRQGENYNRAEIVHLDIAQTNNIWSIVNWDVDE